jgi:hypothetical protein
VDKIRYLSKKRISAILIIIILLFSGCINNGNDKDDSKKDILNQDLFATEARVWLMEDSQELLKFLQIGKKLPIK